MPRRAPRGAPGCSGARGRSALTFGRAVAGRAQIFCNGVEVMSCGGTKAEYIVDVWSGNHPFYQGNKTSVVSEDGRVNRFNKMYGDLADTLGNVATINNQAPGGADEAAPAAKPAKAAPKAAQKGKKK